MNVNQSPTPFVYFLCCHWISHGITVWQACTLSLRQTVSNVQMPSSWVQVRSTTMWINLWSSCWQDFSFPAKQTRCSFSYDWSMVSNAWILFHFFSSAFTFSTATPCASSKVKSKKLAMWPTFLQKPSAVDRLHMNWYDANMFEFDCAEPVWVQATWQISDPF